MLKIELKKLKLFSLLATILIIPLLANIFCATSAKPKIEINTEIRTIKPKDFVFKLR